MECACHEYVNNVTFSRRLPYEVQLEKSDSDWDESKSLKAGRHFDALDINTEMFEFCYIDEDESVRGLLKDERVPACIKREGDKVYQYTLISTVSYSSRFFRDFTRLPKGSICPSFLDMCSKNFPNLYLSLGKGKCASIMMYEKKEAA